MDLDGAGFSGRFLPFLRSRSLPFKAAVFREWWDGRVGAWVHFVPVDGRLGGGFWGSLAYFMGVGGDEGGGGKGKGEVGGEEGTGTGMERGGGRGRGRIKEGEAIAERGREWAGRVLRKEDMEIYFFRLLLEWGRLTDERRDEIGFQM